MVKKILILLSFIICCLHSASYAGDGASGGGSCSLWDSIFKGPNSMANPKYANDGEEDSSSVIYREENEFYNTPILKVHSFTTEEGIEIQLKNIVAFIIIDPDQNKTLDQLQLKDIKAILNDNGNGYLIENIYRIELHQ